MPDSESNLYHQQKVWGPVIRIWHWLLVVSVISGWLLGEFRNFSIMQWHIYAGYCTGILLIVRIALGLMGPPEVRFSALVVRPAVLMDYVSRVLRPVPSGVPGHNPLGALSVIAMLILLAVQVSTGLFAEDDGLFYEGPLSSLVSESTVQTVNSVHLLVSEMILIVVMLHISAILFYLIWKKENLIIAMITGWKKVKKSQ